MASDYKWFVILRLQWITRIFNFLICTQAYVVGDNNDKIDMTQMQPGSIQWQVAGLEFVVIAETLALSADIKARNPQRSSRLCMIWILPFMVLL